MSRYYFKIWGLLTYYHSPSNGFSSACHMQGRLNCCSHWAMGRHGRTTACTSIVVRQGRWTCCCGGATRSGWAVSRCITMMCMSLASRSSGSCHSHRREVHSPESAPAVAVQYHILRVLNSGMFLSRLSPSTVFYILQKKRKKKVLWVYKCGVCFKLSCWS